MIRLVMALALAAGLGTPAFAQTAGTTNMEIFRQKITADKKLLIAQNLNLTDAEGAAFWPVYDAYQKDLQQANHRLAAVIVAYADAYGKGTVADDVAKKLIEETLAIEESEARDKSAVAKKVLAVLPAAKAARYLQMENKVRALMRYEIAANIPLVD